VPPVTRRFERVGDSAAGSPRCSSDVTRVRPGRGIFVDAEIIGEDSVLRPFISCRPARQKQLGKAIHTGPAVAILGRSAWHEVGPDLRQALGSQPDFTADAVANPFEVAELEPRNAKQLMDGVDPHPVKHGARLDPIAHIHDTAATVKSAGNHLDAVGGQHGLIGSREGFPPRPKHLLGIAKTLVGIALESTIEEKPRGAPGARDRNARQRRAHRS
jgi:hypothetical protein